ncbi:helix-turn-helix domain-containing protein [Sporolactobacillus pectinivorans]|uniref:helix-turn-helix domain-containing protein n=1 Tax=Sporolactobacillus pectinivorans TaxID=1591408 RepID=UPI000C25DBF5|nr:helix-turn-helix domain-containing protein [Sporolactobacillus pectinivorans]
MSELGQALREAREEKGLSLDDLQEETKIQKRYLSAIEKGDFKQLPGDFYLRAFIKSYAEAVGLDFSTFAQQYASEMPKTHRDTSADIHTLPPSGSEEVPAVRSGPVRSRRPGRSSPVRWSSFINKAITVVFILIVLVLVYILITGIMSHQGSQTGEKSQGAGSSVSFKGTSASSSGSSSSSSRANSTSSSSSDASSGQQTIKLDNTQGQISTYTLTGTTKFMVVVSSKTGLPAWFMAKDAKTNVQIQQGIVSNSGKKSFQFDASSVQSLSLRFGSVPNTSLKINGQSFNFPNNGTTQDIIINFSK